MNFLQLIIHTSVIASNFHFAENMSSQHLSGVDANKNQQT